MSDTVAAALITAIATIIVAAIGITPYLLRQEKRQKEIVDNTRKTGNGWTDGLAKRLDRMETSLEARIDLNAVLHNEQLREVSSNVARLEGRFEEHLRTTSIPTQRKDDDDGDSHDHQPAAPAGLERPGLAGL